MFKRHFVFFASLTVLLAGPALAATDFDPVRSGLRMLWGLLVVLGIMFAAYYLLRKRVAAFQHQGKGIITILETRHIHPKKSLILIEVRGKEYLVGAGGDTINTIIPLQSGGSFSTILENTEEKLKS
ncbi:MAG TPA: flagellar biosynthetic protein FliO [Desulfopila sp.]|nr:flagellar biosynthetic protein FliO [Desulfopila sp.]